MDSNYSQSDLYGTWSSGHETFTITADIFDYKAGSDVYEAKIISWTPIESNDKKYPIGFFLKWKISERSIYDDSFYINVEKSALRTADGTIFKKKRST